MENKLSQSFNKDIINILDKRLKSVALSTLICGFLAHGMVMFNEYAIGDNVTTMFGVGATITSGRWFLEILGRLICFIFGGNFALPVLTGVISLIFLGISSYIVILILDLKRISSSILVSAVMIMFPTVVSMFIYNFTAQYYSFAVLLISVGVYIICNKRKWYSIFIGALIIACAIGIYQAFLGYAVGLLALAFIKQTENNQNNKSKTYLYNAIYLIAACFISIVFYFIFMKFFLWYFNLQLSGYQGINTMGFTGLDDFLLRLKHLISYFLIPGNLGYGLENSMFPMRLHYMYYCLMAFSAIMFIWNIVIKIRDNQIVKSLFLIVGVIALPIAANLVFLMCSPASIHSLMLYGEVTLIIFAIWMLEIMQDNINIPKQIITPILIVMFMMPVYYCYYDNIYYLKLDLTQDRAINYCNVLVSQIKSSPGYKDEYPVVYIEPSKNKDKNIVDFDELKDINITPLYDTASVIKNVNLEAFLNMWCAYKPKSVDDREHKKIERLSEVKEMPCYPDDGSIKVINDVVVVKFGNPEE